MAWCATERPFGLEMFVITLTRSFIHGWGGLSGENKDNCPSVWNDALIWLECVSSMFLCRKRPALLTVEVSFLSAKQRWNQLIQTSYSHLSQVQLIKWLLSNGYSWSFGMETSDPESVTRVDFFNQSPWIQRSRLESRDSTSLLVEVHVYTAWQRKYHI